MKAVTLPGSGAPPRNRWNLLEINVICWCLFVVFLAVPGSIVVRNQILNAQRSGSVPENDFVYFYSMGRVFNEYPAAQLYDYGIQQKVATEVHRLETRSYGPNAYHPLIGIFFQPFARMPYLRAYMTWIVISFSLYLAALFLCLGHFSPNDHLWRSLVLCLSLCFYPVFWIVTSGQLSTIGFLAMTLAFREDDRAHPFRSGLALSLCLYKPPLLTLMLPMLLVTRRYRTLAGFACGAVAGAVFVTGVLGAEVWPGYMERLLSFASGSIQTGSFKILWYYLDLPSFFSLIPGGGSWAARIALAGCVCAAALGLLRAWWNSARAGQTVRRLVWAATLTWGLVLNVYVPIYDSILVVPGIIATATARHDLPVVSLNRAFMLLWPLILACSWVTVPLAQASGFQVLTLLLSLLGVLQLRILHRRPAPGGIVATEGA